MEKHAQQKQDRVMLDLLWRLTNAASDRQQSQLEMSVRLSPAPTDLRVRGTRENVSEHVGLNGIQAFNLLERLVLDGYVNARIERSDTYVGKVAVYGLTGLGLSVIGKLPDPEKRLLVALDAIAEAIESLPDRDLASKAKARGATDHLKGFLSDLPPGIAVEILGRIATVYGVPGG